MAITSTATPMTAWASQTLVSYPRPPCSRRHHRRHPCHRPRGARWLAAAAQCAATTTRTSILPKVTSYLFNHESEAKISVQYVKGGGAIFSSVEGVHGGSGCFLPQDSFLYHPQMFLENLLSRAISSLPLEFWLGLLLLEVSLLNTFPPTRPFYWQGHFLDWYFFGPLNNWGDLGGWGGGLPGYWWSHRIMPSLCSSQQQ